MPWVNCTVTAAGPADNGVIYIGLKAVDGSFNNWFIAASNVEKEMLAVALSAISGGKVVLVFVTATAPYSTITRFYIRE